MFRNLKVRGDLEPDLAHSLWNTFRGAFKGTELPDGSDFQTAMLKLTIAANYAHGAYRSGDKHLRMKSALEVFLSRQNSTWWENFSEDMAQNRQVSREEGSPVELLDNIMNSQSVRAKGLYATRYK